MARFIKVGANKVAKLLLLNLSARGFHIHHINFRGKSEKDLNNLRQEIEILRRLKQENIILLLDAFETAHEFCLVTEVSLNN